MNEMQQKFYNFITERTKLENLENVKELLKESFEKQKNGSFNLIYLTSFIPKLLDLIKDEYKEEVSKIVEEFKKNF